MQSKYNKNSKFGGLSVKERELIQYFSAGERETVTVEDILAFQPIPKEMGNKILSRLAEKGWLRRLKRGIYVLVPVASPASDSAIENAWPIAMKLFKPAFISGWTAAEHWDLTEQIFNTISLVTQTPQRKVVQEYGGIKFKTKKVSAPHFFGSKTIWIGSSEIQIAEPTRLIIDILDSPPFGGGGRHTIEIVKKYFYSEFFDSELLLAYAKKIARGSIFKRIGFLVDEFKIPVPTYWIQTCHESISTGITNLDPNSPSTGRIVSRWKLRINLPL